MKKTFNGFQRLALQDEITKGEFVLHDCIIQDLTLDFPRLTIEDGELRSVTLGDDSTRLNLTRTDLRGVDASDRTLADSAWTSVNVSETRGQSARVDRTLWRSVRVTRSDFRTSTFRHVVMDDSSFVSCDLSYTQWEHVTFLNQSRVFDRTPLAHANFRGCVFVGVDWSDLDDLDLARFEDCQFVGGRWDARLGEVLAARNLLVSNPEVATVAPTPTIVAAAPLPKAASDPRAAAKTSGGTPAAPARPSRFSSLEMSPEAHHE